MSRAHLPKRRLIYVLQSEKTMKTTPKDVFSVCYNTFIFPMQSLLGSTCPSGGASSLIYIA
jgi:hypothetical protein